MNWFVKSVQMVNKMYLLVNKLKIVKLLIKIIYVLNVTNSTKILVVYVFLYLIIVNPLISMVLVRIVYLYNISLLTINVFYYQIIV